MRLGAGEKHSSQCDCVQPRGEHETGPAQRPRYVYRQLPHHDVDQLQAGSSAFVLPPPPHTPNFGLPYLPGNGTVEGVWGSKLGGSSTCRQSPMEQQWAVWAETWPSPGAAVEQTRAGAASRQVMGGGWPMKQVF
ncbi:uncharacterized protein LOC132828738 isoform X3 [Hemiscyllium ocellatum]|uniref:uncharacterized protein LOC132828738 isoform X3 n=1 Tax=Hemiscyllium ocellatum TaxID=170820 RepID=UPI002966E35E|nr:uncharacterized protein LOC132828738 isoform X3 [Hemiscyllium ocellatum]